MQFCLLGFMVLHCHLGVVFGVLVVFVGCFFGVEVVWCWYVVDVYLEFW